MNTPAWAAAAGFESFWLSQVFGVDPIVALAAVDAEFPALAEMGTSVVPLAGRHPLALAAQARTAQSALDGRFTLGIGTSHQMVVEGFAVYATAGATDLRVMISARNDDERSATREAVTSVLN